MKWKSLPMPEGIRKSENNNDEFGSFVIEPLERGWGVSLGNILRRILLSSLQGASVTAVKIEGVTHEFDVIEGVKEDIPELLLNLKQLRCKLNTDSAAVLQIGIFGEGVVTAANIDDNPDVEILNPDLYLATLDEKANLQIEIHIAAGRGYVEANQSETDKTGLIALDASFSPVTKINFEVSDTRVGQRTDLNSLKLDIHTNGSILPEDALSYGAKLLSDHLDLLINFEGDLDSAEETLQDIESERISTLLQTKIDDLELSVRSSNCLKMAQINTLGQLVKYTEAEMLKFKNFGRKSLVELNEALSSLKLHFGMSVESFEDIGK